MFEDAMMELTRVDIALSDADRVDRLTALERVKAACAAARARITAEFAESQAEVAEAWRERARECAPTTTTSTGGARHGIRRDRRPSTRRSQTPDRLGVAAERRGRSGWPVRWHWLAACHPPAGAVT